MKDSEKGMIDFIALGVEGTNGTLDRVDFLPNQHPNVFNFTLSTYAFKFKSQDKPIKWVLYPHYKNGQWGTRQEGEVKV